MTSDGTYTYVYDGENRLKEVKQETTTTYEYDDAGNLLTVEENSTLIKSFSKTLKQTQKIAVSATFDMVFLTFNIVKIPILCLRI